MPEQDVADQNGRSFGISETKDVLIFVCRVGNYAAQYKGLNMATIIDGATKVIPSGISALSGIGDVPHELADLQDEEIAELRAAAAQELALDTEAVEQIVTEGLEALLHLARMANMIRAYKVPTQP